MWDIEDSKVCIIICSIYVLIVILDIVRNYMILGLGIYMGNKLILVDSLLLYKWLLFSICIDINYFYYYLMRLFDVFLVLLVDCFVEVKFVYEYRFRWDKFNFIKWIFFF